MKICSKIWWYIKKKSSPIMNIIYMHDDMLGDHERRLMTTFLLINDIIVHLHFFIIM